MFVSFFPRPKAFFISAVLWTILVVASWYAGGERLGALVGLPPAAGAPIIGVSVFWSPPFVWFYVYFAVATGLFAGFWFLYAPHRWATWSILGSALILFVIYFQVQVSVAINNWYGPFYNLIQAAVSHTPPIPTALDFYDQILIFLEIALVSVTVSVLNAFFVSHYIFRWRTAMNEYYMANWSQLRHIEGASQRVQEDTMRFASTVESLGVSLVGSVMTLIAFLPVLMRLSADITVLPFVGKVPYPLVLAAIFWSLFGTVTLALVGVKLPGLEFKNQRVEAGYRKELVYGEDDEGRAQPITIRELFGRVRRNYFRLYFHYTYFNIARFLYLQLDNVFSLVLLIPSIVAGIVTLGALNQISNSFSQVTSSFQYLVNSWTTIVELLSIFKRLRAFEAAMEGEPLPVLDQAYLAGKAHD